MIAASGDFTGQVLRELVAAMGGALFVGNLMALIRRRRDQNDDAAGGDLARAPVARTIVYVVVGFVVMVWGIASLLVA